MIVIRKGGVAQNESHHPKFLHKKIIFQKIILNDHLLHIYRASVRKKLDISKNKLSTIIPIIHTAIEAAIPKK